MLQPWVHKLYHLSTIIIIIIIVGIHMLIIYNGWVPSLLLFRRFWISVVFNYLFWFCLSSDASTNMRKSVYVCIDLNPTISKVKLCRPFSQIKTLLLSTFMLVHMACHTQTSVHGKISQESIIYTHRHRYVEQKAQSLNDITIFDSMDSFETKPLFII